MKPSARAYVFEYNSTLEGVVPWMYLDIIGLVTVGVGNLIDPIRLARGLQMVRRDGTPASQDEVDAEWRRIKSTVAGAKNGHRWIKQFTSLRMTDEGMRALVDAKCMEFVGALRKRFPDWDTLPADAQLGIMSLTWACGPAFPHETFAKAIRARQFERCGELSQIAGAKANPGIIPRNARQRVLFANAAEVERRAMDPDVLYYPEELDKAPEAPARAPEPEGIVHPPITGPHGYEPPDDAA